MAAGNQQVAAVGQQNGRAFIGAALGQVGQQARFRQVGGGDRGQWQQAFAQGIADIVLAQGATATGAQHGVADHRDAGQRLDDFNHRIDHFHRAEHAQLDGGNRQVGHHRAGLG